MILTPDDLAFFSLGIFSINATIAYTWLVMLLLSIGSWLISRRLSSHPDISYLQNLLEVLVTAVRDQIEDITRQRSDQYLAFIGTLFLFIITSNLLAIVPGYYPPTGSLSTTAALAICVFIAVPLFGISNEGLLNYLRHYIRPSLLMLPFNLIGELSRVISLAVRLYGNIMSGTVIVGILLSLMPFFFPVVIQLLGLITGVIQAYIFAVLAIVYIASASSSAHQSNPHEDSETDQDTTTR